jgi:hypothetical protein
MENKVMPASVWLTRSLSNWLDPGSFTARTTSSTAGAITTSTLLQWEVSRRAISSSSK